MSRPRIQRRTVTLCSTLIRINCTRCGRCEYLCPVECISIQKVTYNTSRLCDVAQAVSPTKDETFIGDTLAEARGAMVRWLSAHRGAVVKKEYPPIETPPSPGENRTVSIRIEVD